MAIQICPFSPVSYSPHFALSRNDVTSLTAVAAVVRTLGHDGRLRILSLLRAGPLPVCQIAAALDMPLSTLSGHLLELRRADLVAQERKGKWVYHRLSARDGASAVLGPVLAAIADDPTVRRDAARAAALERTPLAVVCDAVSPVVRVQP